MIYICINNVIEKCRLSNSGSKHNCLMTKPKNPSRVLTKNAILVTQNVKSLRAYIDRLFAFSRSRIKSNAA